MALWSLLGATATPLGEAVGNTTGWPLLVLMSAAAVVVGGTSILYLVRRFGRGVWGDRPRNGPSGPRA